MRYCLREKFKKLTHILFWTIINFELIYKQTVNYRKTFNRSFYTKHIRINVFHLKRYFIQTTVFEKNPKNNSM